MRVLIINSDSVRNRGDRAILSGNIALVRELWPDADIWACSEYVKRDEAWFGIRFLSVGIFTLNPLGLLKTARFARQCDVVLWGGGEILKDYTNKAALLYWAVKMALIWLGNRNLYGAFQGVGATKSRLSRALVVFMVNLARCFLTRDAESADRLRAWGTRTEVVSSYDPAVMMSPRSMSPEDISLLLEQADLTATPGRDWVGIGLRRWFHYSQHGWIPFRWKQEFRLGGRSKPTSAMEANLAALCDWLVEQWQVKIIFFPMHLASAENDVGVACEVMKRMKHSAHAACIMRDNISPQEYLDLMSLCSLFIGVRLHSCILAATAGMPTLLFYYSEKGRRFFDQAGMPDRAIPIQALLDSDAIAQAKERLREMRTQETDTKAPLSQRVNAMREKLRLDFRAHIKASP